ncbi:hypothetical protein [Nonomuraea sp. NPDC049480]|uniref:hypothetical protein n=1 Tax=Nonomuraea sp. NPDC049480 TaxID=3364353 RepID=UPI0037976647
MATPCRGRNRPGDILIAADQNSSADATVEQELSLAGWDNEGGQTQQLARGGFAP